MSNSTALKNCEPYCAMFNPTVYNDNLEGDLNKFAAYSKSIANLSQKLQEEYDEDNKFKGPLAQKSGRLLEDNLKKLREHFLKKKTKSTLKKQRILATDKLSHPDFDAEGKMDEDANVVSQFNKEFKTSLVR